MPSCSQKGIGPNAHTVIEPVSPTFPAKRACEAVLRQQTYGRGNTMVFDDRAKPKIAFSTISILRITFPRTHHSRHKPASRSRFFLPASP
jgi:hypothetical protein